MSGHANVIVIPSHVSYSHTVQWNHTESAANIYSNSKWCQGCQNSWAPTFIHKTED